MSLVNGTLKNKVKNIVIIIIAPNPLKIFVPIVKSKRAITPVLTCPSLIAGRLLALAVSIPDDNHLPSASSSLSLS